MDADSTANNECDFIAGRLRAWLSSYNEVRIREEGAVVARLRTQDCGFALHLEAGKLVCHFWTPEANLVRRVIGLSETPGRLKLSCLRMGRRQPTLLSLEAQEGEGSEEGADTRADFRQMALAAIRRDWPEWRLQRSAGGRRAGQRWLLRRGALLAACVAIADEETTGAVETAIAGALAWAERLRTETASPRLAEVRLIVPAAACRRLGEWRRWLRPAPALHAYTLDRSGERLNPVPLEASGNLESHLRRAPSGDMPFTEAAVEWLRQVRELCPAAKLERSPEGSWRIQVYGLVVVRQAQGADSLLSDAIYGCGREQSPLLPESRPLCDRFLAQVNERRRPDGAAAHPLYTLHAERWMEDLLLTQLPRLDANCDPRFLYRQVPACQAGQRDILDLLGVDRQGRLLVLELKASEDLGFPLQALDYWLRVRAHLEQGDFERLGYFPGVRLSPEAPRLRLIAPALRWHPDTDALLRWLTPAIEVERVGLNEQWRSGLRAVAHWWKPEPN